MQGGNQSTYRRIWLAADRRGVAALERLIQLREEWRVRDCACMP